VTLSVWLPWPVAALSPNSRSHWSVKALAVKNARHDARILAMDAMKAVPVVYLPYEIPVLVTFVPNRKLHAYDYDNAQASLKAYSDGIADALGVNDARFRYTYIHEGWQDEAGIHFAIGD